MVKDSNRRSYFMQVFDMNNRRRIWEQEIYFELKYQNPKDDVHMFEAERSMVAFHFAQIEEAADFYFQAG